MRVRFGVPAIYMNLKIRSALLIYWELPTQKGAVVEKPVVKSLIRTIMEVFPCLKSKMGQFKFSEFMLTILGARRSNHLSRILPFIYVLFITCSIFKKFKALLTFVSMPRSVQQSQTKWISRLAASQWTRLFILTTFLQAFIVFVLESEILKQTLDELVQIEARLGTNSTSTPVLGLNATDSSDEYIVVSDRFRRMKWENVWFMAFQVWLFWIAFDGIYNQNTVEIVALAAINVLCAIYACVQVGESIKWKAIVDGLGIQVDKIVSAEKLAIGMMICIMIFAIGLFYLSWQLFRQFGWNVYKKIGADLQLRSMYRTFQMYVLILKVDLYFEFATSVFYVSELIIELNYVDERQYAPLIIRAMIALSILPALYGARRVIAIESYFWAIAVIVFHLVVFINFTLVLHETILPDYNWYFWIFILVCGIVISLATSLGAFLTLLNFNKGLKPFVQVSNTSETTMKGPRARFELESDSYSPSTFKDIWETDEMGMEKISTNKSGREDREALIRRSEDSDRLHSIDIGSKTEI